MKKFLRVLKWLGIILFVLIAGLVIFILTTWDKVYDKPYPDIHASADSATIAHGKYLVYGPAHCASCHAAVTGLKDMEAGIEVPLVGGHVFDFPPGKLIVKNLTSDKEDGIGNYTDGEIARALRYNVKKDGRTLVGVMPFANMSDEDIQSVISYLRTLAPVKTNNGKTSWNFMGKMVYAFGLIKPEFPEGTPPKHVNADTTATYGKYLALSVANCRGCHTNRDLKTGGFIGPDFAGGFHMEDEIDPGNFYVSRNLTPDPKTGHMYNWSQQDFINRFHQGRVLPNSPMPWASFKMFSDDDLKAIYNFLLTLKPIEQDNGAVVQKE